MWSCHILMAPQEQACFRILRLLEQSPELTQRQLADELSISLRKVNYLLNALVEKGHIKIAAFRRSGDKLNRIVYRRFPLGDPRRRIEDLPARFYVVSGDRGGAAYLWSILFPKGGEELR